MASLNLDFSNTNSVWGGVLVETLARLGVRQVVISPGSRSTPLTFAFARHAVFEAIPVLDERSAGFFALGLARQKLRPVVLLCTSGTAGANYFPAIIEAQESGVPLLVITADRPPEMRDCSSGQTISQQRLFGDHVNFYHELAVPAPTLQMLTYLRQTVAHAVGRTALPSAGPVHLNAPFRDPLPPAEDDSAKHLRAGIDESFFAHFEAELPSTSSGTLWQRPTTARGLIVAGAVVTTRGEAYARKVAELSNQLGWPILADALSPLRAHLPADKVVTAYDSILRDSTTARDLLPRSVLCLGSWPTSKVLRSWLESFGGEILLIAPTALNRDALHGRTRQINAPVESLAVSGEAVTDSTYAEAWCRAEAAARRVMDETLAKETTMFEPKAAWILGHRLPRRTAVVVANSMPVRDVEYFWPAGRGHQLFFNRGANGIDGTLSTALGVAHRAQRTVLLTGDLALLHDANGFLLRPKFAGSLTIVLINNQGGGIFEHLPVAEYGATFENFFATPQEMMFDRLAAAYGIEHIAVRDWKQFEDLIATLPDSGVRVLEIQTERKRDAARRKQIFAAVARAARF